MYFANGINSKLFCNFRANDEHFGQSKSTSFINWKMFSGFGTARILNFMKKQLICVKLYVFLLIVLTHEFIFFIFKFRAFGKHFVQSKSTYSIKWKLFSGFETTRISIFMLLQLMLVELFIFYITVLTYEFYFVTYCIQYIFILA
jgi:hypothetical protein